MAVVTNIVIAYRSQSERRRLDLPAALYLQLWRAPQPGSPVSAARARPQTAHEPAHTMKGRA